MNNKLKLFLLNALVFGGLTSTVTLANPSESADEGKGQFEQFFNNSCPLAYAQISLLEQQRAILAKEMEDAPYPIDRDTLLSLANRWEQLGQETRRAVIASQIETYIFLRYVDECKENGIFVNECKALQNIIENILRESANLVPKN